MSPDHFTQWKGNKYNSEPLQMVNVAGAKHSMCGHAKQTWLGTWSWQVPSTCCLVCFSFPPSSVGKSLLARAVEDLSDCYVSFFFFFSSSSPCLSFSFLTSAHLQRLSSWSGLLSRISSSVLLALFCLDSLPSFCFTCFPTTWVPRNTRCNSSVPATRPYPSAAHSYLLSLLPLIC